MKRLTMRCGDGRRLVLSRALPDREARCLGMTIRLAMIVGSMPSFLDLSERLGSVHETEIERGGLVYLRTGGDPVLTGGVQWRVEEAT